MSPSQRSQLPRFLILSPTIILRRFPTSAIRKHFHSHHTYIHYITSKICGAPQQCPDHSHIFKLRASRLLWKEFQQKYAPMVWSNGNNCLYQLRLQWPCFKEKIKEIYICLRFKLPLVLMDKLFYWIGTWNYTFPMTEVTIVATMAADPP